MNLDVLISTIDSGIGKVPDILLNRRSDVSYLISHQYTDFVFKIKPSKLLREDVRISHIHGKGVAKSRNNAIELANGDIGLFSDDDVKYEFSFFDTIIKSFIENPDLDVGLFKIKTLKGEQEYKSFPTQEIYYNRKAPSVGTIQIAFRISSIRKKKVFFDERFGAGNKFLIGSDEQIFLQDCINSGLVVKYFPKYVVIHPFDNTVKHIFKYDNRRIRVTGGLDARINGPIAIIKSFLGTIKFLPDLIKYKKNPLIYFWERLRAAVFIIFTRAT